MSRNASQQGLKTKPAGFWLGWLADIVAETLVDLEAVDEHGEAKADTSEVARHLRAAWDRFAASDVGVTFTDQIAKSWAGFVVEDAKGEAQALRETHAGAVAALDQAEAYWDEAAASGHPVAPAYVAKLHPFRIRQVTQAQWAEILEKGTPVLDREP